MNVIMKTDADLKGDVTAELAWDPAVKFTATDLARRIQEALTRQALREAKHIQVAVDGTTVTLSGTVHSWHERDAVQGVVWAAPGVNTIINDLRVG